MEILVELSDLGLGAAAFAIDLDGDSVMNIKKKSGIQINKGYNNIFHGGILVLLEIKYIVPTRHSFSDLLIERRLFKGRIQMELYLYICGKYNIIYLPPLLDWKSKFPYC